MATMRASLSFALLAIMLASPVSASSMSSAACLRLHSQRISAQSSCGDHNSISVCLLDLPDADLKHELKLCFRDSGCTEEAASNEATWTLERCDTPTPPEDDRLQLRKLHARQAKAAVVVQASDDDGTSTSTTSSKTTVKTTAKATSTEEESTTATETATDESTTAGGTTSSAEPSSTSAKVTTTSDESTSTPTEPTSSSPTSPSSTTLSTVTSPASVSAVETGSVNPINIATNIYDGKTTILTCFTPTTIPTTACSYTTAADKLSTLSCWPTTIVVPTCHAGYQCSHDGGGHAMCLVLRNQLTGFGVAIAIFFAVVAVAAFTTIVAMSCHEKKTNARLAAAAEQKRALLALETKRPAGKAREPLVGAGEPDVSSGGGGGRR